MKQIILAVLMIFATRVSAATITSVSGASADGDTLTIFGTSFGTHSLNTSFLGGVNGAIESAAIGTLTENLGVDHWGTWLGWNTANHKPQVSNIRARTNRTKSIRAEQSTPSESGPHDASFVFSPRNYEPNPTFRMNEIYVSWWTYYEPVISNNGATLQWKMFRLNSSPYATNSIGNYPGDLIAQSNQDNVTWTGQQQLTAWNNCFPDQPNTTPPCFGCVDQSNQGFFTAGSGTAVNPLWLPRWSVAGRWMRWEFYARASSLQDVRDGEVYVSAWAPGETRKSFTDNTVVTHHDSTLLGDWRPGQPCAVESWLSWTRFGFQNWSGTQGGGDVKSYHDDIYLQWGNRAHIEVGNNVNYASCTQLETCKPTAWADTAVTIILNRGSFAANTQLYAFVINEAGVASNGMALTDVTVETVLPATATTGVPFWADFWVKGGSPWRAAAFKVYYDSTRVIPIRYAYTGGDSNGCLAEFDDKISGEPKVWPQGADADVWINYDKGAGVTSTDDVMVGRVQFLPVASGWARIQTSPSNRSGHYGGGGGVNQGCMGYFPALDGATEAAIITSGNGASFVTPDNTGAWTTVIDSVNVSGAASDRCVGNWDGHPPKEGIGPGGSVCSPLAIVFTAADSSVSSLTDTLEVTMNVWADSVRSIQGYIEYNPECTDTTQTNLPISCTLAPGVGFNVLEVDFDYGANHTIPFQVCTDAWPDSILWGDNPKYIYFKVSRSDSAQVSIAGPLLTIELVSPDPCQDQFSIGLPCQTALQVVYSTEFVSMLKVNYEQPALDRGKIYLYETARYGWLSPLYLYVQNLNQYAWE